MLRHQTFIRHFLNKRKSSSSSLFSPVFVWGCSSCRIGTWLFCFSPAKKPASASFKHPNASWMHHGTGPNKHNKYMENVSCRYAEATSANIVNIIQSPVLLSFWHSLTVPLFVCLFVVCSLSFRFPHHSAHSQTNDTYMNQYKSSATTKRTKVILVQTKFTYLLFVSYQEYIHKYIAWQK